MKTTIVPAQITTVEDKIAGNLGLSQIMLLVAPIFFGSIVFVILPPFYSYATYKLIVIGSATYICGLLAIRFRGVIVLFWLCLLVRYNRRPTYYVFDKNSAYLRETVRRSEPAAVGTAKAGSPTIHTARSSDTEQLERVVVRQGARFMLSNDKKGRLRVHITKVASPGIGSAAD